MGLSHLLLKLDIHLLDPLFEVFLLVLLIDVHGPYLLVILIFLFAKVLGLLQNLFVKLLNSLLMLVTFLLPVILYFIGLLNLLANLLL